MAIETFILERDDDSAITNCAKFVLWKPNQNPILTIYIWNKYYQGPMGGKTWRTRRTSAASCYPFSGFRSCDTMLRMLHNLGIDTTEIREAMIEAGWQSDITIE